MYQRVFAIVCVSAVLFTTACTGPSVRKAARSQKQAAQAQSEVAHERLELVEKYQACVAGAGEELAEVEACDVYLKSAEALS